MAKVGWCGIDWDKDPWTDEGREKIYIEMNKIIEERKLDNEVLATAYSNRANVFSYKNEFEKAISDYTAAMELNPNDELTYLNRARTYYDMKKYKESFTDVKKAILLDGSEEKLKIAENELLDSIKRKLNLKQARKLTVSAIQ
jgi:tetratricopeptide (TPR) repeat protein